MVSEAQLPGAGPITVTPRQELLPQSVGKPSFAVFIST